MDPGRRRLFIAMYAVFLAACAGLSGMAAKKLLALQRERGHVEQTAPTSGAEVVWSHDGQYVVDDVVGWRPRPNIHMRHTFKSIDGTIARDLSRKHNNMGFLDEEDWSTPPPGRPAVLLIGDSHMMGIVSNRENAAALLEARLAAAFPDRPPVVVNGSSGYYSLYQYYLRARQLADVVRPKVLVAVVYMGNDFYDMEDAGRPHLDDALREKKPTARLFTDQTIARLERLGLPMELNSQATNQASYFAEMPARRAKVLEKAGRSVELLAELARDRGFALLWVLLPSYDMVFPEVVRQMSAPGAALIDQRVNEHLHQEFSRMLEEHREEYVDLLPLFLADKGATLYAADYHVWQEAHRLLADAVYPALKARLRARSPRPS